MTESQLKPVYNPEALSGLSNDTMNDETTEVFLAFDITAAAFITESAQDESSSRYPARLSLEAQKSDLAFLGAALAVMTKEWFSKPKNLVGVGVVILIILLIMNFKPLTELAKDKMTAMLPPEIELPKTPPPPMPTPPPPEPTPPPPEPTPEPPEPIPEEPLEPLDRHREDQQDDMREKMDQQLREDQQMPGVKVTATKRDDVVPDLPAAFGNTDKRPDDTIPSSLSNIGTRRTGPDAGSGGGNGLSISGGNKRRSGGDEGISLPPVAAKKTPERSEGTGGFSGVWKRVSNLGPLAHLNYKCYGVEPNKVVYSGSYKLQCRDNQIVAAWKKE